MIRRNKKSKKRRGYTTHGWGSKKKHRGSGNRGGFGMAGTGKRADQKKPSILKEYGNTYFGKKGFFRHSSSTPKSKLKTINVGDLDRFDGAELDLTKLGVSKLLGAGSVTKKVKVIVKEASASAIEKVKNAGGEVVLQK